jgi:hypothetical protein
MITLGPLTTTTDGQITLIGVASFSPDKHCSYKSPMVFARVSDQLDWIRKNTDVNDIACSQRPDMID